MTYKVNNIGLNGQSCDEVSSLKYLHVGSIVHIQRCNTGQKTKRRNWKTKSSCSGQCYRARYIAKIVQIRINRIIKKNSLLYTRWFKYDRD